MNNMVIFENSKFGNLRTVMINGKPYFCASDVAKALGYKNDRDAIRTKCKCVAKHDIPHPQSKDKEIEVNFIPESDVYRLIFGSKLKSAEEYQDWVFETVLPQLREKGYYNIDPRSEQNKEEFVDSFIDSISEITKMNNEELIEEVLEGLNIYYDLDGEDVDEIYSKSRDELIAFRSSLLIKDVFNLFVDTFNFNDYYYEITNKANPKDAYNKKLQEILNEDAEDYRDEE